MGLRQESREECREVEVGIGDQVCVGGEPMKSLRQNGKVWEVNEGGHPGGGPGLWSRRRSQCGTMPVLGAQEEEALEGSC